MCPFYDCGHSFLKFPFYMQCIGCTETWQKTISHHHVEAIKMSYCHQHRWGLLNGGISGNIIIDKKGFLSVWVTCLGHFTNKIPPSTLKDTPNLSRPKATQRSCQDCNLARCLNMFLLIWRRRSGFMVSSFTSHPTGNPVLVHFNCSFTLWLLTQSLLPCVIKDWNEY